MTFCKIAFTVVLFLLRSSIIYQAISAKGMVRLMDVHHGCERCDSKDGNASLFYYIRTCLCVYECVYARACVYACVCACVWESNCVGGEVRPEELYYWVA